LRLHSQSGRYFIVPVPIASFDENIGLIFCECPEFGRFLFESTELFEIKHPGGLSRVKADVGFFRRDKQTGCSKNHGDKNGFWGKNIVLSAKLT